MIIGKGHDRQYVLRNIWYESVIKVKGKLATVVEEDPKAPFSIATTLRCNGL